MGGGAGRPSCSWQHKVAAGSIKPNHAPSCAVCDACRVTNLCFFLLLLPRESPLCVCKISYSHCQVVIAYTVGMAAALLALQATPAGASTLQWIAIAALGFTIYGPQMLIGLSGAELVAPGAVGASQGILGWIAYLGAANAGGCLGVC